MKFVRSRNFPFVLLESEDDTSETRRIEERRDRQKDVLLLLSKGGKERRAKKRPGRDKSLKRVELFLRISFAIMRL